MTTQSDLEKSLLEQSTELVGPKTVSGKALKKAQTALKKDDLDGAQQALYKAFDSLPKKLKDQPASNSATEKKTIEDQLARLFQESQQINCPKEQAVIDDLVSKSYTNLQKGGSAMAWRYLLEALDRSGHPLPKKLQKDLLKSLKKQTGGALSTVALPALSLGGVSIMIMVLIFMLMVRRRKLKQALQLRAGPSQPSTSPSAAPITRGYVSGYAGDNIAPEYRAQGSQAYSAEPAVYARTPRIPSEFGRKNDYHAGVERILADQKLEALRAKIPSKSAVLPLPSLPNRPSQEPLPPWTASSYVSSYADRPSVKKVISTNLGPGGQYAIATPAPISGAKYSHLPIKRQI